MEEKEYLTISDFASAVGVTPQAVYNRLGKDLSPFVKVIQGRKHLSIDAKELFKSSTSVEKADDSRTLDFLLLQLEEKDRQLNQQQATIEGQSEQIRELQSHIMDQSKDLTDLLRKQNQLQENYQILLRQHQEAIAQAANSDSSSQSSSQIVEQAEESVDQSVEQPLKAQPEEEKPAEKTGFLKWLFGR